MRKKSKSKKYWYKNDNQLLRNRKCGQKHPFTVDEGLQIIFRTFRLVFNALSWVYWNDYRQKQSNGDSTAPVLLTIAITQISRENLMPVTSVISQI